MKTTERRTCPVCNTLVDGDSDMCPVCALKRALAPENHATATELRFEHYEILKNEDQTLIELGHGAMGVTYKALDVQLQRPVALKIINAKFIGEASARQRFVREARAAASVRHPNVATVYHLGEIGGDYFYAMEFVEGETLANVIHHAGRINTDLALEITAQVAAGLDAIHKQHLVHRDIKSSNIMVDLKDGQIESVKIIDLGLAKGVAEEGSISVPEAFVGTPGYASPEQIRGIGIDIRSDLYSLGIVLWEMLTGSVPFQGTISELLSQHMHAPLPADRLARIPKQVVPLLEVLLEKDPVLRFQTPNDLLKALAIVNDAIDSGHRLTKNELRSKAASAALPKPSTILSPAKRDKRIRSLGWLALALVAVALLFGVFLFFGHRTEPATSEKSIAVLPFDNLSANKDDAYFADGVQDEILNNLAKIAQLKVISRTSVMQYRADAGRDLRQIANALGVVHVLEGTVRRDGNHVRVSADLVDARNDHTIWAESYDRDLTDIFAIQSEVAQTIVRKLNATLSPEEQRSIKAKPTDNLEAYDLYLRANELILYASASLGSGDLEKPLQEAIGYLERAVRLDPRFALAYCASASAHDLLYYYPDATPERRALGDAAINSALGLQPDLPEVHLAYAYHLYYSYQDYDRARAQLAIARRGLPNDVKAIALEAYIDRQQGDFENAIQELKRAITLDPRNKVPLQELADTLYFTRQFGAVEHTYDQLQAIPPDQPELRVAREATLFDKTGEIHALRSAIDALPSSIADSRAGLSWRLSVKVLDRNWAEAKGTIKRMKGGEDLGSFAYGWWPVPVDCYSILIARLQGEPEAPSFAEVREQMNQKIQKSTQTAAPLLSQLAVVDALLGHKETAISEAKRAIELFPISKDALRGPRTLINLAVVYAWTNELDAAFATLDSLTKTPFGIYYGALKVDPIWDPLRTDPRFDKLLAKLAPKD